MTVRRLDRSTGSAASGRLERTESVAAYPQLRSALNADGTPIGMFLEFSEAHLTWQLETAGDRTRNPRHAGGEQRT